MLLESFSYILIPFRKICNRTLNSFSHEVVYIFLLFVHVSQQDRSCHHQQLSSEVLYHDRKPRLSLENAWQPLHLVCRLNKNQSCFLRNRSYVKDNTTIPWLWYRFHLNAIWNVLIYFFLPHFMDYIHISMYPAHNRCRTICHIYSKVRTRHETKCLHVKK